MSAMGQKETFRYNRRISASAPKADISSFMSTPYVAAGFFFGFAVFGGATGSATRSIELRRPAVKV
jgi:hypothetical protein